MKNTRKILIALLVLVTLLVSVFAINVSAADTTKVYVDNDAGWSTVNCYYWNSSTSADNTWPGKAMTYDSTLDLYYYEIPSGYDMCIFNNGSNQTADLAVPTGDAIVFNNSAGTWSTLGGEVVYATFTVAGNSTALFGTSWDVANTANDMTYDSATGIYTKVYTKVPAGSYAFKCAQNHSWTVAYPSSDKNFTVSESGSTVTITLNTMNNNEVLVTVEPPKDDPTHTHSWSDATCTAPQTCSCGQTQGEALGHSFDDNGLCTVCSFNPLYIVAGDVMKDSSENYVEGTNFFGGSIWIATDENNKLSYNPVTGLFEKTYTGVLKGEYHFKVVLNKSWDTSYGYNGTVDNCYIKVDSDNSTVTITFNPNTNVPEVKVTAHVHTKETIPAVDATCTSAGSTEGVKCSACGEILTAPTEIPATGHSYDASTEAPTCTETGLTTYTCSACGDSYTETIEALGHTFDETQWGYKGADGHAHTCSCGAKDAINTHTPNADAPTEDTAKYCVDCGYVIEAALGHVCNISELKYDADGHWYKCTGCEATSEKSAHTGGEATCIEPAKCTTCEQPYGKALGHSWTDATCTAPKTCSVCGATDGEALGHSWTDATCTAPKTCSVCGATDGEALGHTFTDATCTAPKTCSACGTTDGEALGHTFTDATCTAPKTCSVCGATDGEAKGHSFADATCTAPKTCSVCGATEGKALGHSFVEGKCSCGATDPDYVPEVDDNPAEPELSFFEKIWQAILAFIQKILGFFK